jgi:hypothetical protein
MNGSEIQIDTLLSHSSYPITQSRISGHSSSNLQIEDKSPEKEATSKYVVEDNRIVYEKYDQHGKLIYKVPWNKKPFDVTA